MTCGLHVPFGLGLWDTWPGPSLEVGFSRTHTAVGESRLLSLMNHSSSSGGAVCSGAEPLAGGGGCFPVTLLPSYHSGQCRHALQFVLSDLSILQIFTVLGAGDTAVDPASMVPTALEGVTRETRYLSFPL